MKKLLLLFAAASFAAIPMTAQMGNTVREDRVWNYTIDNVNIDMETTSSTPDYGYHFKGIRATDGIDYAIFYNGDGIEVALMRQECGKVYLHLDNNMKEYIKNVYRHTDNFEEIFGDISPSELLLYNFDAEVGDSYYMPVFYYMSMVDEYRYGPEFEMFLFTVTDKRQVVVGGNKMTVQTISDGGYDYNVVEGIGPNQGMLHRPQFGWLNTGTTNTYAFLQNVCNSDGEVICEKNAEGLWPWERKDDVTELAAASRLSFNGKTATADGEHLTIYAISGKVVAEGCGEVSTEFLQPGVYIAKAGTRTLKILVK